jgi:WhiB family transcriptional regulator, redox-sensing transcriptional regulator
VTAAEALGPRQAAVLAHLEEHPGLTVGELARVFGLSGSLHHLLYRLQREARVIAVTAWEPHQGRRVSRWHAAPLGTMSPTPLPPADPEVLRRHRERDRVSQRARRARARGLAVMPGMEPPSLRDRRDATPDLRTAACKGADPDLFFPVDGEFGADGRRRVAKAAAICAGCSVRGRCYRLAAERGEQWGVWGGVDFGNRKKAARAS